MWPAKMVASVLREIVIALKDMKVNSVKTTRAMAQIAKMEAQKL